MISEYMINLYYNLISSSTLYSNRTHNRAFINVKLNSNEFISRLIFTIFDDGLIRTVYYTFTNEKSCASAILYLSIREFLTSVLYAFGSTLSALRFSFLDF